MWITLFTDPVLEAIEGVISKLFGQSSMEQTGSASLTNTLSAWTRYSWVFSAEMLWMHGISRLSACVVAEVFVMSRRLALSFCCV